MKQLRICAVTLIVTSMLMALLALVAPSASAHSGTFDHDDIVFKAASGDTCPQGSSPNGGEDERFLGCRPDGYSVIGDKVELCDRAREEGGFAFVLGGFCTYDQARSCTEFVFFVQPIGDGMCVRPALILTSELPVAAAPVRPLTPACVESTLVQATAASQIVGSQFTQGGIDYLIVSGPPCTFNCVQGWDINCDGKIGDFCASEYDLTKVSDVGRCLDANSLDPTID